MALSYIAHMERNEEIRIDDQTGQLEKDLDRAKWKRLTEDFSMWMEEVDLDSHVGQIQAETELYEAQV